MAALHKNIFHDHPVLAFAGYFDPLQKNRTDIFSVGYKLKRFPFFQASSSPREGCDRDEGLYIKVSGVLFLSWNAQECEQIASLSLRRALFSFACPDAPVWFLPCFTSTGRECRTGLNLQVCTQSTRI